MVANVLSTEITSAAVSVWAIQKLKSASWFPILQHDGALWANRIASIVLALATSLSISHVWNPGAAGSGIMGVLTITVPTIGVMATGLWHWAQQYVYQELIYQGSFNASNAKKAQV